MRFDGYFDWKKQRLDDWWMGQLDEKAELSSVVKKLLILSHGNAGVERGFSANKLLLVENLEEHSLIAVRHVKQAIKKSETGVIGVNITSKMRMNARMASQRRRQAFAEKKEREGKDRSETAERKRKAVQLEQLEEKRKKLAEEAKKQLQEVEREIRKLR